MMRNYKADLFAFLFIALVASSAFLSNSCKKEMPSVKPIQAEVIRQRIVEVDSSQSEKYRIEAAKWERLYKASHEALTLVKGKDKRKTEKAQYSAATFVKSPNLDNCRNALSDCQAENEAKAKSLVLHSNLLVLADSLRQLDKYEIARLNSVKDTLNTGWMEANKALQQALKPRRWAIGVMAGYGITKDGISPVLSVGITRNLIRF